MNFFSLILANLFNFLFARDIYLIEVDGTKLFVNPRSMDMFVVAETYLDRMYDIKPLNKDSVKTIVDLGAHIGDSAVWLTKRYSPDKLIAVEMDKDCYSLLKQNILLNKLQDKIVTINKAIYSNDDRDLIYKKSRVSIMHSLNRSSGKTKVKTISLRKVMDDNKIEVIDYLKMDIEGAEQYLFTKKNSKLFRNNVGAIAIECHPNISLSHEAVKKYLEDLGFEIEAQKTTILNSQNKTFHAINKKLNN